MKTWALVATSLFLGVTYAMAGGPAGTRPAPASQPTMRATTLPAGEPALAVWNAGIYLLGVKPFVEFAAWEDGTILRRSQASAGRLSPWERTLQVGHADPNQVKAALAEIEEAGWFKLAVDFLLVRPDGPERRIAVRAGDRRRVLSCGDAGEDPNAFGERSSPTRAQVAAFLKVWKQAESSLAKLSPPAMTDCEGPLPLQFPSNTDPSWAAPTPAPSPAPGASRP